VWVGVYSAWEQENVEARKMLENAAESHTSGARFVGQFFCCKEVKGRRDHNSNAILFLNLVRSTIVSLFQ